MPANAVAQDRPVSVLLEAIPLTWDLCQSLAGRLAAGDTYECLAVGRTPEQSLAMGLMMGPAWAVTSVHTGTPVGAFGYTPHGTIWSLWAKLSRTEALQVLRETPHWVRSMVRMSGQEKLHNHAACANTTALDWLRLSGCFWIEPGQVSIRGHDYRYFETLPLEAPPHV